MLDPWDPGLTKLISATRWVELSVLTRGAT